MVIKGDTRSLDYVRLTWVFMLVLEGHFLRCLDFFGVGGPNKSRDIYGLQATKLVICPSVYLSLTHSLSVTRRIKLR